MWDQRMPRRVWNLSNLKWLSTFMKMSAIMSLVEQSDNTICLWESVWQMKWKWTSICLVWPWNFESLERVTAPCLLQNRVVGTVKRKTEESSVSNLWIQIISFKEWVIWPQYWKEVMIGCFFELQVMAPIPTKKTNPEIEWQWICDAQSAPKYPAIVEWGLPRTSWTLSYQRDNGTLEWLLEDGWDEVHRGIGKVWTLQMQCLGMSWQWCT